MPCITSFKRLLFRWTLLMLDRCRQDGELPHGAMKPGHNDTESLGDGDEDDAAALPASLLGVKLPLTISPSLTGTVAQTSFQQEHV